MTDQLNRFRANLTTIADCYALLAARDRESLRDERTKPDHTRTHREYHDDDTSTVIYGQPTGAATIADPVAHALPTGPTKERRNGPVVGGSTEAKVPISLDVVDLLAPANADSLTVAENTPWPGDQIGHLAVATLLDAWVHDIATFVGEKRPVPTVPVLAMWLNEWAGWAWDHYHDLDKMVITVDRIARTLHATVNPRGPRPETKAAACPMCAQATLRGDGERVWCADETCGRILTEAEYGVWATAEAHRELNGGQGMSAREIAIRWNRPPGTVRYWAHQYAWPRTSGEERPVLYLRSAVEETMAGILAREAAEREAKVA